MVFILYFYVGGIIETSSRRFFPFLEQANSNLLLAPFNAVYESGIVVSCTASLLEKWLFAAHAAHF